MSKISIVISLFILIFSNSLIGQGELNQSKDAILSYYEGMTHSDTISSVTVIDTANYVIASYIGETKQNRIFIFNPPFQEMNSVPDNFFDEQCDSIVYQYYCTPCLDEHFETFTHKSWKWLELEDGHYVSKVKIHSTVIGGEKIIGRPQIWFVRSPKRECVGSVHISTLNLSKDEWKRILKGGK